MKSYNKLFLCLGVATMAISCGKNREKTSSVFTDWEVTGGDPGITHFSELEQIHKGNVAQLRPAWTFSSGSKVHNQCNPIVIEGTLYFTTGYQELIALNAKNGTEKWRFQPTFNREERPEYMNINRGMAAWRKKGLKRIFFCAGNLLLAVDGITGKPVESFGDKGKVDMNQGHHLPPEKMGVTVSSSPVVIDDLIIIGASSWSATSHVAAYDVRTGKRVWKFNTIPHEGEFGHKTYGDKDYWKKGAGVNVWGGISVDEKNDMIFFGTGQPKGDFYRPFNPGKHLFGNSVVALKASSGERVWHYQIVHHDLWDVDVPCAPVLAEVTVRGKKIPAAIQITKTGDTFIFHRLTGEVLSDVEEVPVKQSQLPGERSYPTQPMVSWPEPFSRQKVALEHATTLSDSAHNGAVLRMQNSDLGRYDAPSEKGIIYYGLHGGGEWGGPAYHPEKNWLFINTNQIAWHIEMVDASKREAAHPGQTIYFQNACVACHGAERKGHDTQPGLDQLSKKYGSPEEVAAIITKGRGAMPAFPQITGDGLRALSDFLMDLEAGEYPDLKKTDAKPSYAVKGYNRFLDENGYPATTPPWGALVALDLDSGELQWKVPLGTYPELIERGLPPTGTENFGGSLVTSGGLLFIGATSDEKFRAFDIDSGEILWEYQLPYGGYATPTTYTLDGKQYISILATGGGKLGTKEGDVLMTFALP
ncbi:PQQ-binding-like beta-propeller repeat protein [Ulvibacterium sp.]|uniref:outer membrane protein assembly factor BamB family protein n=1 Tax=Ulvibacterium sp. TaxID=2665914 RepID=UPI00262DFFE9|nr:PQQ-binding-like beta-propeller repeat protein [Ulvibacterium sp.]